jgi:hypothetical protein
MRGLIFPKVAAVAALSFLTGAELDALLHGELFPSPYVIIGAIVVGAVVGYVVYLIVQEKHHD